MNRRETRKSTGTRISNASGTQSGSSPKLGRFQELRQPALELRQARVRVHARDVGHRLGGDQPDRRPGALLRHPREEDVHAFAVGQHGGPCTLPVRGQAVTGVPARVAAQPVEIAFEPVIEDEQQLLGGLFLAHRHLLPRPLQVLGSLGAAAPLGGFDESQEGAARRLAPQGILQGGRRGLGRRWLRSLCGSRPDAGREEDRNGKCGEPRSPPRHHGHVWLRQQFYLTPVLQNFRPAVTCARVPLSKP